MSKMVVRPKIQVDASPALIELMKQASEVKGYRSFKEFVLLSIAEANPDLKQAIYRELGLSQFLTKDQ
mgnify:CR=1 FL=1